MTNHFDLAVASMDTAGILRDSLQAAYDSKPVDVREVARLNADLRHTFTMAKLHSNLAAVQATYDLRAVVEQLAKDLNAEPREPRVACPRCRLPLRDQGCPRCGPVVVPLKGRDS